MSEGQESSKDTPKAKRVKQIPALPPKRPRELITSTDIRYFKNPLVLKEFQDHCVPRTVFAERQVSGKFLEDVQWPYIQTFKSWGWWDFITFDREVYVDAVRMFYFNGDNRNRDDNGNVIIGNSRTSFWTRVLDRDILIDDTLIMDAIGDETNHGEDYIPKNFSYVEACQLIYNKPELQTTKDTIHDLPFHHRILHLIVCQILTPRLGTYTTVTKDDMYWMYKIIQGEQVDLTAWIIARMITCLAPCHDISIKCTLPYAKLISQIIEDKCRLGQFEPVDASCKRKILNESFLKHWLKDEETGEYKRKKEAEAEEAARANEAEPSVANILDELRLMHWTNLERFDDIAQDVKAIAARQTDLETRQTELEKRQARFEELLKKSNEDA